MIEGGLPGPGLVGVATARAASLRTPLGKALFYLAHRWTALTRFFEDRALELDNGAVERAVRGIAIGFSPASTPATPSSTRLSNPPCCTATSPGPT